MQSPLSGLSFPHQLNRASDSAHPRAFTYKNSNKIRIFNTGRAEVFQIPRPAWSFQPSEAKDDSKELRTLNSFIVQLIFRTEPFVVYENKNEKEMNMEASTTPPP